MNIIIGLGNPDKKYEKTRHNAGFMALDALAKKLDLQWEKSKKFNSQIAKDGDLILVKPETFMNNSGQAVRAILDYYKVMLNKDTRCLKAKKSPFIKGDIGGFSNILTVIHDDLDIPLGKYKISVDSRSAGHNGVQSIINHLGTKNFKRIRIGIKPPLNPLLLRGDSKNLPAPLQREEYKNSPLGLEGEVNRARLLRSGRAGRGSKKIPADLARQNKMEAAKFVLQKFNKEELKIINEVINEVTNTQ